MSERVTAILTAVRAKVESLGFALDNVTLPVYVRREAMRRQELDPKSMITVAKSKTPESPSRRRFGLWQTTYLIDVVVHGPYAGPDAAVTPHSAMRDAIVDAFKSVPLAGADDVFDLNVTPADWLSPSGDRTDWDWWCVQIEATVAHS